LGLSGVKIFLTAESAECAEKNYKNSAFSAGSAVKLAATQLDTKEPENFLNILQPWRVRMIRE
jgi:hypothetical protein